MAIELPDGLLDAVADQLAPRLAERLAGSLGSSPAQEWMTFEELVAHVKIPEGTLRKLVASGEVPKHGGKTHVFFREEVNEWLLGYSRRKVDGKLKVVG